MKALPKIFDLDIRPLQEPDLDLVAGLHRACFPEKIESILGARCITDTFRERILGPAADTFAFVAVNGRDGRYAGFVYASHLGSVCTFAHAFISRAALRKYLLRRVLISPDVWRFIWSRVARKMSHQAVNEGDTLPLPHGTCVVKMLGIAPEFRFGNAAIELMQSAEAEAQRRGATRLVGLVEHSNKSAERLYEWLDWRRTTPERRDFAVFAMCKDLSES